MFNRSRSIDQCRRLTAAMNVLTNSEEARTLFPLYPNPDFIAGQALGTRERIQL